VVRRHDGSHCYRLVDCAYCAERDAVVWLVTEEAAEQEIAASKPPCCNTGVASKPHTERERAQSSAKKLLAEVIAWEFHLGGLFRSEWTG
jgi:hypothetical protein